MISIFGGSSADDVGDATGMNSTKRQPKQPRKPILYCAHGTIADEYAAVVRFSWFREGVAREVEEFVLEFEDVEQQEGMDIFRNIVVNALHRGADVSLITPLNLDDWWEELGAA